MRFLATGIAISLLTGCAVFPHQETLSPVGYPNYDTTPVSAKEMQCLVPGEWYQVRLPERDGRSHFVRGIFRNGYVGRLQECDENSLTLTDVTKCTDFDSTSALRHLPLWGSHFEEGWGTCKNKSGPVTVPRTQLMWFEPISAEKAEPFRRFDEIVNTTFSTPASSDSTSQNAPVPELSFLPDTSFLLPNPELEEVLSRRRIEILEIQADQWYFVVMRQAGRGSSKNVKAHLGLVHQVNDDSITLTNVTTQGGSAGERFAVETSSELKLPRSQIESVRQETPEQAAELIAEINEPRE